MGQKITLELLLNCIELNVNYIDNLVNEYNSTSLPVVAVLNNLQFNVYLYDYCVDEEETIDNTCVQKYWVKTRYYDPDLFNYLVFSYVFIVNTNTNKICRTEINFCKEEQDNPIEITIDNIKDFCLPAGYSLSMQGGFDYIVASGVYKNNK